MLKELQEKLKGLLSEISALGTKADRTDEETKSWTEKLDAAEALKGQIDGIMANEAKQKSLTDWAAKDAASQIPAPGVHQAVKGFEFDGKAGTDLFKIGPDGEAILKELEGSDISQKLWREILEPSYKTAYMRVMMGKADQADMGVVNDIRSKALAEGLDTGGGYLVPPDMMLQIIKRDSQSPVFVDETGFVTTTRDQVNWPKLNYTTDDIYSNPIRIAWVGENAANSQATDTAWGEVEIPVYTGSFQIEISRNLLEDSPITVEQVLIDLARESFNLGIEDVTLNGTGIKQPMGILTNAGSTGYVPSRNLGNPVTADNLIAFVYNLFPQYRGGAKVAMNSIAMATYGIIKNATSGDYLFGLANILDAGLATARIPALLGFPILESPMMPSPGAANNVMIIGNFKKAYMRAMRIGLAVEPYGLQDKSMLQSNKVGYNFRFRQGGAVVQPRAALIGVQS